jgi:hypothetical protein
MRSPWVLLAVALAALCGSAAEAWACSCVEQSPCAIAARSETIFLGRVLEVTLHPAAEVARVQVLRVDRGAPDRVVTITGPSRRSSCGFGFTVGERFFYYGAGRGAAFTAHPCSGSGSVPPGEPDPELPRAGRVSGSLNLLNENLTGWRDALIPLAGKRVWIQTPDRVLEATSRDDGRFTIDNVPVGVHSVHADVGPEFDASDRFRLASPTDCAVVAIIPTPVGRIVGSLTARGFPLAGIDVMAVRIQDGVDERGLWTQRSARPDADGNFAIEGLKPGQYVLSVNPYEAPTTSQPFPATYYPGVERRAEAHLVMVGSGTTAVIKTFELPTMIERRTITADVSCVDGTRPAAVTLYATRPGDRYYSEYGFSSKAERPSITLLQGTAYDLHASITLQKPDGPGRPPAVTTIKTDAVRIAANEAPALVRLTLPLARCP